MQAEHWFCAEYAHLLKNVRTEKYKNAADSLEHQPPIASRNNHDLFQDNDPLEVLCEVWNYAQDSEWLAHLENLRKIIPEYKEECLVPDMMSIEAWSDKKGCLDLRDVTQNNSNKQLKPGMIGERPMGKFSAPIGENWHSIELIETDPRGESLLFSFRLKKGIGTTAVQSEANVEIACFDATSGPTGTGLHVAFIAASKPLQAGDKLVLWVPADGLTRTVKDGEAPVFAHPNTSVTVDRCKRPMDPIVVEEILSEDGMMRPGGIDGLQDKAGNIDKGNDDDMNGLDTNDMAQFMAKLQGMDGDIDSEDDEGMNNMAMDKAAHFMDIQDMDELAQFMNPHVKYKDVSMIRRTEMPYAKKYIKFLEPHITSSTSGPIVDIGSMSGFIPTCYCDRWPDHQVIASDVEVPLKMDPTGFFGMPLLRNTLTLIANDVGPPRQERYLAMRDQVKMIDVLQPNWTEVSYLHRSCAAVICTSLLNMKGFETPDMWRMVLVGAAQLLREQGVLFMADSDFGSFGDRLKVEAFAQRVGFVLEEHSFDHRAKVGPTEERDFYNVLLRRSGTNPEWHSALVQCTLSSGDAVVVSGLNSRKDLNGMTGVLLEFENERWGVRVAAGETANRKVEAVRVKPDNLRSLMGNY